MDRVAKLRNQQEVCLLVYLFGYISELFWIQRQTLAYLLVRQATSLLQRTRLNVTVVCQAWHAKNNRHLLLGIFFILANLPRWLTLYVHADLIDFTEPTMLIVGSRGLGKIKGFVVSLVCPLIIADYNFFVL